MASQLERVRSFLAEAECSQSSVDIFELLPDSFSKTFSAILVRSLPLRIGCSASEIGCGRKQTKHLAYRGERCGSL